MALTKITGEGVGAVDSLTVQDDSTGIQPILFLKNDNTTDDNGMSIDFSGKDTSSNTVTYGRIDLRIPNHATEKSDMRFYTRNDSGVLTTQLQLTKDENAVFAGGLSMNGETAASNILDDYEEGTFTPSYGQGVSSATYSVQAGRYTKVGNRVFFEFEIDGNSITGDSNTLYITGLPFTAHNAVPRSGATLSYTGGVAGSVQVTSIIFNNTNTMGVYKYNDGGTVAGNTLNLNGGWIWFGHYDI